MTMRRVLTLRLLLLAAATAAAAFARPAVRAFDLDVAIPSGTPLDWKSELPTRYVRPESLLAITRGSDGDTAAPLRARPVVRSIDVVDPSDVLTLDFAGHLGFQPLEMPRNTTGLQAADRPYPPLPDVDLYWRTTVALLQMMLHPARVLRLELQERLLLTGEGALPGLEAAQSLGELADEVKSLRSAIGSMPSKPPEAIAARDPYASMMQRLVADELCLARPYASDLVFAERLVLLRDEIVPFVLPYATGSHSFARRNAVALLALIDSPSSSEALTHALASEDLVVKVRAIQGLARRRQRSAAAAMRAELPTAPDPVITAALIRALGELGDAAAIPLLLTTDGPGHARADLFIERLIALTRVDVASKRDAVEPFLRNWLAVPKDAGFLRGDVNPAVRPDNPDPPDARARVVEQLARLVEARLDPADAARRATALEPLSQPAVTVDRFSHHVCASLGAVAPLARYVFVEALGTLGPASVGPLTRIANDATCESDLRFAALQALPLQDRTALAAELALDRGTGLSLRIAALELLDDLHDARAAAVADELGPGLGMALRDADDPLEHWRLLVAVQVLGRRGKLTTAGLVQLLHDVDPRRVPHRDSLIENAKQFIADAQAAGSKKLALHQLAVDLLSRLAGDAGSLPRGFGNPGGVVGPDAYVADAKWLVGQAEAVLERPKIEAVKKAAIQSIANYLKVFVARWSPAGRLGVDPFGQVPLLETILMELARRADDAAIDALAEVVRDRGHPQRAAACLALGATGKRSAGPHLLYTLKDGEPFVRLCAYLGLKRLTGKDFFVDWLAADDKELERGFQEWGRWLVRGR
jgi:HEAT repeat protein